MVKLTKIAYAKPLIAMLGKSALAIRDHPKDSVVKVVCSAFKATRWIRRLIAIRSAPPPLIALKTKTGAEPALLSTKMSVFVSHKPIKELLVMSIVADCANPV
jgi:hypothetical protein